MPDARTLDELCAALGILRSAAGAPSYAEIARRIGRLRGGEEPAKVTVYDCFRPGRRRVDDQLIGDIATVLGAVPDDVRSWRELARTLNGQRSGVHIEVSLTVRHRDDAAIGREALIQSLPAADVILLTGLPGVGKTTLATALAPHEPVLAVDLRASDADRPAADPVDVLRRMLGALGHRSLPYELSRLRERLLTEARDRTVVLEDAGSAARLLPLIVPGVRYLVTSRRDLAALASQLRGSGISAAHVPVAPLDAADARRLLVHLLTPSSEGVAAASAQVPAAAIDRIVTVAAGLPLDLAMLAGIVHEHPGWTFDDLASRFEQEPRDARIRPVLEAATRSLPVDEAELLADLALIDRELDERVLRVAGGDQTVQRLARLRARHLVEQQDGHVQMHATVFAFAAERSRALRPSSSRRAFVARLGAAVLEAITTDDDYAAAETSTVLAVARAAHEHGLDALVEQLAIAAHPALVRWSLWNESMRLHDLAARGAGLDLVPDIALGIAQCAEKLGRFDEALVTLHRVRRIAEGAALARTWNQIGNVQRWMSHLDEALDSYGRSIEHARAAGDRVVEGRATGNHADTLRILARYPEAEREYAEALVIASAAGDELNITIVRGNRALLLLAVGRLEDAERELEELLEGSGGRSLPYVRRTMALVAEARGDDARALQWIGDALDRSRYGAEYGTEADLILLGARIDARAGRCSAALAAAEGALRAAERAGSPLIATEAANSLAEILLLAVGSDADQDALRAAERHAMEARGTAEATGDRAEVARSDRILAMIALARGRGEEAEARGAAADALSLELGHRLAPVHDQAAVTPP
ncbi:tetratricopeptide repeat protein [Microbacterium sp.]|uniref:tetratricopeptide repeat protein n=1 Tax=Microbacterium sp. TaxID=51671 RepID=UPI002FE26BAF